MIPAPFDYARPTSVDDAVALLERAGDDARILAGGHSLLPMMKLRLTAPELIVDLTAIDALRGVGDDGTRLRIAALTTLAEVAASPLVRSGCGLLAEAIEQIGDPQVRNRSTIGGAVAHSDPAGDLPAVMLALDAEFVTEGPAGRRTINAGDFFVGYLENTLRADELLVEVTVPKAPGHDYRYLKFSTVSQSWAIVAVAVLLARNARGGVEEARIGLTNMGPTPLRARAAESRLRGRALTAEAIARAAEAADEGTAPMADPSADVEYRRHLARVLTRRALEEASQGGG